jgi:hypothetical protein
MTCQELVELVTEYLEDALPGHDRKRFEDHLAECRYCENHLGQMRTTVQITGGLGEDRLPEGALDELRAAFRDWKRGGR